jgi:hypothetical protein
MSNRIQGASGTLRRHPIYFPTKSKRIQVASGTRRRHSFFLQRVRGYKLPQEHYDAILSIFLQRVTGHKLPQEHYGAILSIFLQRVTGYNVSQVYYDAILSIFLQRVTRYKVPQEHHDTSLPISYTVTCCVCHQSPLSSHSYPSQKTVIWTSIWEPDICVVCLRDESAVINSFQPKKVFCFGHSKEHKTAMFVRSLTVVLFWSYLKSQNAPLDGLRVACFLE